MSVENAAAVDFIGTEKGTGRTILTISDHLPWGSEAHLSILEKKITAYVGFIESGQLSEVRPEASNHPIEIRIVCQFVPDEGTLRFLDEARQALAARSLRFSWRVLQAG